MAPINCPGFGALGGVTTLTEVAAEVADPDMELALLRMSGPRLQAALSGALLLAAWVDFINLADVVLRECPAHSVEKSIRGHAPCAGDGGAIHDGARRS